MERGIKIGMIVGVLAVIVGVLEGIVIGGGSIGYLRFVLSNPIELLTSLVWNVTIFAILGGFYDRRLGGSQAGSAGDASGARSVDSEMSGFDE